MSNVLKKYVRGILKEAVITGRKLDRYSTVIRRHVINAIKHDEVRDYFRNSGSAKFKLQDVPELDDIEYLRDVIVSMEDRDDVHAYASYEYDLHATPEQRRDSDLKVTIELPRDFPDQVLSHVNEELTDAIRHELEHSGQETWELMDCTEKTPTEADIWKSLKNAAEYYMCPAEIKAHVAGFFKRAKARKEALADVIDFELYRIYETGKHAGFAEDELHDLMVEMRRQYHEYAKGRYPKAKGFGDEGAA